MTGAPPDHDERRLGASGNGVAWLESRKHLGIQPGLSRVLTLLDAVGNPHLAYRSIHVAGTNGKGSVATYLATALEKAGHHTGLFTSPPLSDVTETITVNGRRITNHQLTHLVEGLKPAAAQLDEADNPPTYFELLTVIALTWFREAGVTWAVVEAGMGGRLDSTNILQPQLAAITNVTEDHTNHIGETIPAIAAEKAGIIKPGVPLVTAARGEALAVIRNTCQKRKAPIVVVGADYQTVPTGDSRLQLIGPNGQLTYKLAAKGEHQVENAAVTVVACDLLRASGVPLPAAAVQQTLAQTALPGRIETIHHDGVRVILDGAHNLAAAQALGRYLLDLDRRHHLIVGFSKDKDWVGMLQQWVPLANRVTAVRMRTPRTLDPTLVAAQVPDKVPFTVAPCFADAWNGVRTCDVVVAGSMFLVGEARSFLIADDQPAEEQGNQR